MKPIEIVAVAIIAVGFAIVFAAKTIVKKGNLDQRQMCDHSAEMSEEEIDEYKLNKATVRIKALGLLVAVPGIVLLLVNK